MDWLVFSYCQLNAQQQGCHKVYQNKNNINNRFILFALRQCKTNLLGHCQTLFKFYLPFRKSLLLKLHTFRKLTIMNEALVRARNYEKR